MNKKKRIINEILEKIRGPYLMESGLIELTAKGLMKCNNDSLNNLLVLISHHTTAHTIHCPENNNNE